LTSAGLLWAPLGYFSFVLATVLRDLIRDPRNQSYERESDRDVQEGQLDHREEIERNREQLTNFSASVRRISRLRLVESEP